MHRAAHMNTHRGPSVRQFLHTVSCHHTNNMSSKPPRHAEWVQHNQCTRCCHCTAAAAAKHGAAAPQTPLRVLAPAEGLRVQGVALEVNGHAVHVDAAQRVHGAQHRLAHRLGLGLGVLRDELRVGAERVWCHGELWRTALASDSGCSVMKCGGPRADVASGGGAGGGVQVCGVWHLPLAAGSTQVVFLSQVVATS